MNKQVKEVIFSSRYLIMCILISIFGLYSTHNHIIELVFMGLIFYSGFNILKKLKLF